MSEPGQAAWSPALEVGCLPFLRWPGGKRWLPPLLIRILGGCTFGRYFEPFLGGGAVFFALAPPSCTLADINGDLINTYKQVRWRPHQLLSALRSLRADAPTYARQRAASPEDNFDRAVRFLYLNRTAFGGLYRTNQSGAFNVPFGGSGRLKALTQSHILRQASRVLRGARVLACDFEEVVDAAGAGDLVFCDPAYSVLHNENGFVRYNEAVFSWSDQIRLVRATERARQRGALVVVCNADHEAVRALYAESHFLRVVRQSRLCPTRDFRRLTTEAVYVLAPTALSQAVEDNIGRLQGPTSYGVRYRGLDRAAKQEGECFVGAGIKRTRRC